MWDVLKEYPAARVRLEAIAVKRLEKYKKAPLEKGMKTLFIYFYLVMLCLYHVENPMCKAQIFNTVIHSLNKKNSMCFI